MTLSIGIKFSAWIAQGCLSLCHVYQEWPIRSLVEIIRKHLEGKRYILVLDDVWEKDVWINNIMEVFPTNCTSRFVLTSRKFEVASLATSNCRIELEPLGVKHSWELFCKAAFRNSDDKKVPVRVTGFGCKVLTNV